MKLSQIIKSVKSQVLETVSDAIAENKSVESYTAVDYFIKKYMSSSIVINNTDEVTEIGDFSKYFDKNSSIAPTFDFSNLPNLTSITGLPDNIGSIQFRNCQN